MARPQCAKIFTAEEVLTAIKNTKRSTAPRMDKRGIDTVKSIGSENVAHFNYWWATELPLEEKECRTILIHKGGDKKDVGQWRPITIGTILITLYAKCWDVRRYRYTEYRKLLFP